MSASSQSLAEAERLEAATEHLRHGRIGDAERIGAALLAIDPSRAEFLHLMGTVRTQQRDLPGALEQFQRACAADPTQAAFWFSAGTALKELERFEEALTCLDKAVECDPSHAFAHCLRGDAQSALGRHGDALASFDKALSLNSRLVDAHNNRGNELRALGRYQEALAAYDRVLAFVPQHAAAIINRGNTLLELRRYEEALAAYERARALAPKLPQLHARMGDALQALDRFAEALGAHEQALALAPDLVQAVTGRATALLWLRRLEEAERDARRALELVPQYAPAMNTLANTLREQGKVIEAIGSFRQALAINPELSDVRHNLAQALLLTNELGPEAWREYEERFNLAVGRLVPPAVAAPAWKGEPLHGKRILVWAEQGFGDTIQFVRLLPLLRERGAAHVTLLTSPRLVRLLRNCTYDVEVVTEVPRGAFDYVVALLSLPLHLGVTRDRIPASVPYLKPEPDRVERWCSKLGGAGFKIGVAWQGNPNGRIDIGRSFPLAALAPLARVPGVRFVSLQKGPGVEQLDNLPPGMVVECLTGFDEGPDAFLDTAAVMHCLDLVVTSDTSVAHLAGALGRPTWLALQYVPDWRWLMHRTDSPWYPTMRLFRQPARGDWNSVFAEMANALAARLRPRRPDPVAPVSWGELADKISILQIKRERLSSQEQRSNVARELAVLEPLIMALDDVPEELDELRGKLKSINERLWEIEDAIRAKEAAASFDQEFIDLARSVYTTNDERARIKRRINDALGSNLVEEKQYHAYAPVAQKPPQ